VPASIQSKFVSPKKIGENLSKSIKIYISPGTLQKTGLPLGGEVIPWELWT